MILPRRTRLVVALALSWLAGFALSQAASDARALAELDPAYEVESLNAGYASRPPEAALRTPKSALAYFEDAIRGERYAVAAQVLNLNGVPRNERSERGPELARKLGFVLGRAVDIEWGRIPDRPDAVDDLPTRPIDQGQGDAARHPRRTLPIGLVSWGERTAEIRLDRVRPAGQDAVWVFSRSTVERIDALYEEHGPDWLTGVAPEWVRIAVEGRPFWQALALLAAAVFGLFAALVTLRAIRAAIARMEPSQLRQFLIRVARPVALLTGIGFLWAIVSALLVPEGDIAFLWATVLRVALVGALAWLGVRAVAFLSEDVGREHVRRMSHHDESLARQRHTVLSVARRALMVVVVLVSVGVLLSQFEAFRTLGTSLLASAGVVTLVLGIAAQSSLGNLVAGIQIALTRPLRIGDTVQFDDTWSYVEEITYTYVVIRTWDGRRFVVPNQHIVSTPQENWDVTRSSLVLSVLLYVDYHTPVEEVRRRYHELVESAEDWDWSMEPSLVVTEAREETLQLRALCSASDPLSAWRLSVRLREQLLAFLREQEHGRYLPRRRVQLEPSDAPSAEDTSG